MESLKKPNYLDYLEAEKEKTNQTGPILPNMINRVQSLCQSDINISNRRNSMKFRRPKRTHSLVLGSTITSSEGLNSKFIVSQMKHNSSLPCIQVDLNGFSEEYFLLCDLLDWIRDHLDIYSHNKAFKVAQQLINDGHLTALDHSLNPVIVSKSNLKLKLKFCTHNDRWMNPNDLSISSADKLSQKKDSMTNAKLDEPSLNVIRN